MRRLREEAGFTLMELITAMSIGTIVLLAMFALLDNAVRLNTSVMSKTDAMQRGRLALDVLTQELRSQVCLENLAGPAIVPNTSTATQVEFYSDFSEGDGTVPPTKRRLTYDPVTGNVTTRVYKTNKLEPVPGDFAVAPSEIHLRLENAALQKNGAGVDIPFLRYYAYQWVGDPPRPEASLELAPPIDANEARRVARVDVTLLSRPTGTTDRKKGVNLTDQIMARHSDPNLAKWDPVNPTLPDPRCV
jgi:prepilin-type N-terminal cleavage/methylation domain-containing protein